MDHFSFFQHLRLSSKSHFVFFIEIENNHFSSVFRCHLVIIHIFEYNFNIFSGSFRVYAELKTANANSPGQLNGFCSTSLIEWLYKNSPEN